METDMIAGLGTSYTPPDNKITMGSDIVSRDDFLRLLVAQLKHQDPLNPMQNEEFVAELATFSSLEQQIKQTELLKQLIAAQQGNMNSQALSMIGQEIVAATETFDHVPGDQPSFLFEAPAGGEVVVTITSEAGTIVRTDTVNVPSAGRHVYQFDGRYDSGSELAPGTYHISVGAKIDSEGETIEYPVFLTGQVTEVRFVDGQPVLSIGNQAVNLIDVLSVRLRDELDHAA